MTGRMEAHPVSLGVTEIRGPKFSINLTVRQVAAKRITLKYGEEIVTWVPRMMQSRAGMTLICYELQETPDEYSEEQIWDNWFEDPNVLDDQSVVENMIIAYHAAMASKEVLADMEAAHKEAKAAQKKAKAEASSPVPSA